MNNTPIDFEAAEFALRQSWEIHRQAFGPILEPAFTENRQLRILLINALNHISSLSQKLPAWVAQTRQMTEQILSGTHPAFPPEKQ